MLTLDLEKVVKEAQEKEFQGVKLWIKPYPASKEEFIINDKGERVIKGSNLKSKFIDVLEKWDLKNKQGKDIHCNKENKGLIFDNDLLPELVTFVLIESNKIRESQAESIKN